MRLLATYCENYRVSALIECEAGELFAASREIETAEELDPSSTLVKYTFAYMQIRFLHDYDSALLRIDAACSPSIRADFLCWDFRAQSFLPVLGDYPEAAGSYEDLPLTTGQRQVATATNRIIRPGDRMLSGRAESDAREKMTSRLGPNSHTTGDSKLSPLHCGAVNLTTHLSIGFNGRSMTACSMRVILS